VVEAPREACEIGFLARCFEKKMNPANNGKRFKPSRNDGDGTGTETGLSILLVHLALALG